MPNNPKQTAGAAFLDTSVILEKLISAGQSPISAVIDDVCRSYPFKMACSFSRLEMKRALMQRLKLAYRYLEEDGSIFLAILRAQKVRSRAASTLTQILAWTGRSIEGKQARGGQLDRILTARAKAYLRVALDGCWATFEAAVDQVTDRIRCDRASERPRRKRGGEFDLSIHERKCRSKKCGNASFILSNKKLVRDLCDAIEAWKAEHELSPELQSMLEMLKRALELSTVVQDYSNCLKVGDGWIHLEAAKAGDVDFVTKNYKESACLCPALNLTMVDVNHSPASSSP